MGCDTIAVHQLAWVFKWPRTCVTASRKRETVKDYSCLPEGEMQRPRLAQLLIFTLALCAMTAPAIACPGVFIRDSQNYDNRDGTGALETVDGNVPKGTADEIVGYDIVQGRKFYVQLRAYLHDPADIRLKPGCVLRKYE
jgi:hypothetical protein